MDFKPNADQQMLSDTLRRFIAERYPLEKRSRLAETAPGYSVEAWKQFADLGILGALFDAEVGGYGGAATDIAIVFEALGAGAVAAPFLAVLQAGAALAHTGGEANLSLLQSIIAGEAVASFAHQEPRSRYDLNRVETQAVPSAGGWRLSGSKAAVPYGEAATHFVVSARTAGEVADGEGISLFLVPADAAGLSVRGYAAIDGGRYAELTFEDVGLAVDQRLGGDGTASALVESVSGLGVLALCASAVGALDVVKASTVEYLRTRTQFGQPIGSFQALQHRTATMLIEIEQARSAVINATAAFDGPRVERERALSAAKYSVGRIATEVAEEAVQLHGGIGMTWELPLTHFVKQLIMLDHQLGDVDHHLERYIALGAAA